jgi:hypothetical protein
MTDRELAHLIKMANQITINLAYGDSLEQSAVRVSDHIVRFWATSMKNKIKSYAQDGGQELHVITKAAVLRLS